MSALDRWPMEERPSLAELSWDAAADDEPDYLHAERIDSLRPFVIGDAHPIGDGDEPLVPRESLAERIRAGLLTTPQVKALTPPAALVDGLLYLDTLAMLYGPSGIGKSFVAADLALHVAHDSWWQGHAVHGGGVLYVVAEGAASFGLRVDAWERHHRLYNEAHPIGWLPWAVNLFDAGWAGALAEVVTERRPALVVLDTFARCALGAEENSARDVGLIVAHLDQLRRAAGSCVLVVHHSGKDGTAGARGSTALRGAMHTELELAGEPTRFSLRTRKQKDAPEHPPVVLALRPADGTESVVVDRPAAMDPDHLPPGVAATLAALEAVDVPGGVSATVWLQAVSAPESSFYRHRKGLLGDQLVVNIGSDARPRYRPASALGGDQ